MTRADTDRPALYPIKVAIPLHREEYHDYLLKRIAGAKERVYAAVFIVDPRLSFDATLKVRAVLNALGKQAAAGIDVRLILGTSVVEDIHVANAVARMYSTQLGVSVRQYRGDKESLHSKFSLIDSDWSIIGSPNWSDGGFGRHVEDSIAIESQGMNEYLTTRFRKIWETSKVFA